MSGDDRDDGDFDRAVRAERARLERDGYAVVEGVIPRELCERVSREIQRFLGVDVEDPATWSRVPRENGGIVPLHHAQAQWDLRQHPRLHRAFAGLLDTERLWVTADRGVFRTPTPAAAADAPRELTLHWDHAPDAPYRAVQGMVYLEDTPEARAATTVAPALFRALDALLAERSRVRDGKYGGWEVDARPDEVVRAPGPAGTLVVWDARMPHGPAPNTTSRPRVSQAVTMFPPGLFGTTAEKNTEFFLTKQTWEGWRGLAGQVHPEPGAPATLTPLGRKLVGFDPW
jgi:hypothetical protein